MESLTIMDMEEKKILYVVHYGKTEKEFYCDPKTNKPKKIIGDGGSNIHIHLLQFLIKQSHEIVISSFQNNYQYLAFFDKLSNVKFSFFWTPKYLSNIYKTFILPCKILLMKESYDLIISATDFLPDSLYAFLVKIRKPKAKWVASYFLEAPSPWGHDNPYRKNILLFLRGLLYWLTQRLSFFLIKNYSDYIFVTSQPDVRRFITDKRDKSKVIVVMGGVDIEPSTRFLEKKNKIPLAKRKYDACFIGRLHYQKGCLELIDIWNIVCHNKRNAQLVIIGNGPLEKDIKAKVAKYKLENNVHLVGFKEGKEKYEIFKQSKIILHPAIYDSGGMAAAEAMAWGLPGISFDLPSLRSYYPKGMIKTKCFDLNEYAKNVLSLLNNPSYYNKIAENARNLITRFWDWDKRAKDIYERIYYE